MTYEPPTPVAPRSNADIANATIHKNLGDEIESLRADNARLRGVVEGMREWARKQIEELRPQKYTCPDFVRWDERFAVFDEVLQQLDRLAGKDGTKC